MRWNSVIGTKEAFAAEELTTTVTSGAYLRLEESFTAVDVRNAMIVWPYQRHSDDVTADSAGLVHTLVLYQGPPRVKKSGVKVGEVERPRLHMRPRTRGARVHNGGRRLSSRPGPNLLAMGSLKLFVI